MTTDGTIRTVVTKLNDDLQQARRRGDVVRVRKLENELRQLEGSARSGSLSDAAFDDRIAAVEGNRAPRSGLSGVWDRFVSWLTPSSQRALANQRAREAARDGRAAGAVEHGKHHGGGNHGITAGF